MKKCIVIGNSPSVLKNKYGEFIDTFDTVIRCNWYQIEGYEEYVGTKTDIWFFRPVGLFVDALKKPTKTLKLDPSTYNVQEYWLRALGVDHMSSYPECLHKDAKMPRSWMDFFNRYQESLEKSKVRFILSSKTSIGLQAINIALDRYDEVWSYGNTFHTEKLPKYKKGRYHYYDLEDKISLLDKKRHTKHEYGKELENLNNLPVKILETYEFKY